MSTSGSNNQSTPPPERSRVAEIVTAFALAGIFLLSAMVLIRSWKSNDDEMVRYVFASIIPLLGSWMGTILAFYFSKTTLRLRPNPSRT